MQWQQHLPKDFLQTCWKYSLISMLLFYARTIIKQSFHIPNIFLAAVVIFSNKSLLIRYFTANQQIMTYIQKFVILSGKILKKYYTRIYTHTHTFILGSYIFGGSKTEANRHYVIMCCHSNQSLKPIEFP